MLGAAAAVLRRQGGGATLTYSSAVDFLNPVSHWPLAGLTDRKGVSEITAFGSHETGLPPIAQQDADGFARAFNGTDAYGTIAHKEAYEVAAGGVFVLMQPDTVAAKMQVFNSGVTAPGSMALEILAGGQPRAYRQRSDGTTVTATGSVGQIVAGTPYLYGVTWGPSGLRLWLLNASLSPGLVASNPETSWATITDTATKYLGRWSGSAIDHFDGVLGHLQFYGTELTQAQIEGIALPQLVVWLADIDAGPVTVGESKFIDFAPHAHPAAGFTPAVLSPPSLGTATAVGTGADYEAGATAGDNDSFTAKITAGGVDSGTATITIDVVPVGAAVDVGALSAFTRSTIDVTALAGWPSGRTPKAVLTQGTHASAYIRRAWKPTLNTGTHMDFIPGWQKTTAQEAIRLQLDDNSEIDLTYTVGHTIPSPTGGGVTRTLDRSGGGDFTTWASAIAALTSGDVLVVRAPAGTWTDSGGHAIPNYVYDVTTNPAPASGVNNVVVIAHPDDVAAGRRPVIWRNAERYARYKYAASAAWQVHANLAGGLTIYQSVVTHAAPQHSIYAGYRDQVGDWIALYNYQTMLDATDRSGILHETTSPRFSGLNLSTYMGPSLIHNRVTNRLEVRLDAPPKNTYQNPSSSAPFPPWDWTKHYPVSTNPASLQIVVTDGNDHASRNMLLNLASRNGWKFYNIDFIYGNTAVGCDLQTTPPQFFGCSFLGGAPSDFENDGSGQVNDVASAVYVLNPSTPSSDMVFDRCSCHGSLPPWGSFFEGKGFQGCYGLVCRREIGGWSRQRHVFRYCALKNWWHFTWMGISGNLRQKWHAHHCLFRHFGMDGGLIEHVGPDYLANRNLLFDTAIYGWSNIGGLGQLRHHSFNVDIRLTAGVCEWAPGGSKWADSQSADPDTPVFVIGGTIPHAGYSQHSDRRYYNTCVGSQNTSPSTQTGSVDGFGSNVGPDGKFNGNNRVFNSIGAVYPSPYAWPRGRSSFVGYYTRRDGNNQYNHNLYFRHSGMLSPGSGAHTFFLVNDNEFGGTSYSSLAAMQSGEGFDLNSTQADPQFVVAPAWAATNPYAAGGVFNLGNYMLGASSPARTGARNLNDQSFPDYDFETLTTWAGGANAPYRGALDPNIPLIEQEVGIVGPLPPEIV